MATKTISFQTIVKDFRLFFYDLFNLHEDEASEKATIKDIEGDVVFRGANLWILIFAILVCSVGLDINSTAVVIGAMLISPLMGPIMGVGLGIGIYDFDLIVRALKNLSIAAVISVLTSALYFWISPLDMAQSELLARTSPTLWDVLIATFGGLAGIIASSRKEKTNAIPGVAIATALMPPLCTAGFGIAMGKWDFFLGAIYLFFINGVFISIATYLIVVFLGYSKKEFLDAEREKRVKRYVFMIVLAVIIPSIYTGYILVRKTVFTKNANHFISQELAFENSQVIHSKLLFENGTKQIDVTLYGEPVDSALIAERKKRLGDYDLAGTQLIVKQGYQTQKGIDLATVQQMGLQLKSGIIEDLYIKNEAQLKSKDAQIKLLEDEIVRIRSKEIPIADLAQEIKAINGNIRQLSVVPSVISDLDSLTYDTLLLAYVQFKRKPKKGESQLIEDWLKARMKVQKVRLVAQ